MTLATFIHLLALCLWVGTMIFFSFVAAPAIFKALPREQAGDVVAKIFPIYYRIGCLCASIGLLTLVLFSDHSAEGFQLRIIAWAVMTLLLVYSTLVIGPKVKRLKSELRALKGLPEHEEKSKAFSRLHGFSMVINLLTLIVGLLLVFLTSRQGEIL